MAYSAGIGGSLLGVTNTRGHQRCDGRGEPVSWRSRQDSTEGASHIIEKSLNHTTGSLGGVAGIYIRFGYLDEMREALDLGPTSWRSAAN